MIIKSLQIKNFRSLRNLDLGKVGRVNLIVGKNNAGKSTILEALRIYASNAKISTLREIAESHDENIDLLREEVVDLNKTLRFQHFFTDRVFPKNEDEAIVIGESNSPKALRIQHVFFVENEELTKDVDGEQYPQLRRRRIKRSSLSKEVDGSISQALQVSGKFRPFNIFLQRSRMSPSAMIPNTSTIESCSFVPTYFISLDELANKWDDIVLTSYEEIAKDALRIIAPEFEDIAFINKVTQINEEKLQKRIVRTANVKLKDIDQAVPLNSMGDGMLRVLQLILSVFSAENGFLLIDEFENGLHYSVQEKVWALIFELANNLNIQVFATTHSWDCIESFAKVASSRTDSEGMLFRVGKSVRTSNKGEIVASAFDETQLLNLTQSDMEVR